MHRFLEKCIKTCHNNQQIKITSVKANLQIKTFRGKNDDEMKNFHENLKKKLTHFLKTSLTNQGKNEDEDEKICKNKFNF